MVFCKRNRKATEQSLLDSATRLFAQKGYENTRTLEIAKDAGANEALIHRYFGGKQGLLFAILKDEGSLQSIVEAESTRSSALDFPKASEGLSLREALGVFFKHGERHVRAKEEFMRIAMSRLLIDPAIAKVVEEKFIHRSFEVIQGALRGYLSSENLSPEELDSIALLVSTSNHAFNFLCKRVHGMDLVKVDGALDLLAQSIEAFLVLRRESARGATRTSSVTTNA
jgi:AcrR family transcriptional regulator